MLPLQGWEKYDTISLKWKGQLVATKRRKAPQKVETVQYDDDESVDTGTMLAGDDVAPGQTIPGMKAHSEKPIPAARKSAPAAAAPKTAADNQQTQNKIN